MTAAMRTTSTWTPTRSRIEVCHPVRAIFLEASGANKRKWVSCQQNMQYRMARREDDDVHPIFGLRKLGQLYVIDAYSRIIEQRLYHVRDHYKEVLRAKRFASREIFNHK